MSDLFQPDYLTKFKKGTVESKKLSPRGPVASIAQTKQPTHSKNKKSFDFASLQSLGKINPIGMI